MRPQAAATQPARGPRGPLCPPLCRPLTPGGVGPPGGAGASRSLLCPFPGVSNTHTSLSQMGNATCPARANTGGDCPSPSDLCQGLAPSPGRDGGGLSQDGGDIWALSTPWWWRCGTLSVRCGFLAPPEAVTTPSPSCHKGTRLQTLPNVTWVGEGVNTTGPERSRTSHICPGAKP